MQINVEFFNDAWQRDPNGLNFRGVLAIEEDSTSAVVKGVWAKFAAAWSAVGATTFRFVASGGKMGGNKPIGESGVRKDGVDDDFWGLPKGTRLLTVEGRRQDANTLVDARVLPQAK